MKSMTQKKNHKWNLRKNVCIGCNVADAAQPVIVPITTLFPIRIFLFYLYAKFTYFYLKCFYLKNRKSRNPLRIVTFWPLYKRGTQPLVGYYLINKVIEFGFKELSSTVKSIHALYYSYLQTQVIDLRF